MSMEHWWNEYDEGKPKYSEKNLPQYSFVHRESHMDSTGFEPRPLRWEVGAWIHFLWLILKD